MSKESLVNMATAFKHPFLFAIAISFMLLVMKLSGVIEASWIVVFAPLIIRVALDIILFIIIGISYLIHYQDWDDEDGEE